MRKLPTPIIKLHNVTCNIGKRLLWENLDITINHGEFIAILGPNGSGKTSLLKVILDQFPEMSGEIEYCEENRVLGKPLIGYIPQQKPFDPTVPLTGRDLVNLGLSGNRYGFIKSQINNERVNQILERMNCADYADKPIGTLSGGEQQRLRAAQSMVNQPDLLLCDEPLLSLDIPSQQNLAAQIHEYSQETGAAVLFVTHEINPILPYVSKVLYLANGKWLFDKPEKIFKSRVLSKLYGSKIEVIELNDRLLIVGGEDESLTTHGHHHSHEGNFGDEH